MEKEAAQKAEERARSKTPCTRALARLGSSASVEAAGEWRATPVGQLRALARFDTEASVEAAGKWRGSSSQSSKRSRIV